LFRGFFGVPGGYHHGDCRRDPFFDAMTHDDDDEDDDDGGFYYSDYQGDQEDTIDDAFRFGFSFGPSGIRIQESPVFGQVFREMEEIFSQLGRWEGQAGPGHFGVPSIMPPPPTQDRPGYSHGQSSGNALRDFMLKEGPASGEPRPRGDGSPPSGAPHLPRSPFHDWTPYSKSRHPDVWRGGAQRDPDTERREDTDLDSAVSSGGLGQVLDQILTPPPAQPPAQPPQPPAQSPHQPRIRSFFQSVSVTKVVRPDGTIEERRTVRDGQGNEETTVTRSGGPGSLGQSHDHIGPPVPGGENPFSDMRDDGSFFSKFFGGFK